MLDDTGGQRTAGAKPVHIECPIHSQWGTRGKRCTSRELQWHTCAPIMCAVSQHFSATVVVRHASEHQWHLPARALPLVKDKALEVSHTAARAPRRSRSLCAAAS